MKKNRMMRLASILLVCVLMTTSVISGTFAKYVTTDSATDTARVAKWGIDVSVGGNLFGKDYSAKTNDGGNVICAATSTSVSASDSNLVAPGTKNDVGFEVKISGTPEVQYTITANTGNNVSGAVANEEIFLDKGSWGTMVVAVGLNDATNFSAGDYYTKDESTFTKAISYTSGTTYYELHDEVEVSTPYYPIVWTLTKNDTKDNTNTRLDAIAAAIESGVEDKSGNAGDASDINYILTWEWPFASENNVNDGKDTILGNLMAADTTNIVVKKSGNDYSSSLTDGTDYNLEVKFAFDVTVTQVD